jgi:hypothetical protein
MTQKMYKQIEKMMKDKIIKRNPQLKGLVKAEVHGITDGFTIEDSYKGGALIDFDILTRQKRNQAFEGAWEEWEKEEIKDILYSSFGQTT